MTRVAVSPRRSVSSHERLDHPLSQSGLAPSGLNSFKAGMMPIACPTPWKSRTKVVTARSQVAGISFLPVNLPRHSRVRRFPFYRQRQSVRLSPVQQKGRPWDSNIAHRIRLNPYTLASFAFWTIPPFFLHALQPPGRKGIYRRRKSWLRYPPLGCHYSAGNKCFREIRSWSSAPLAIDNSQITYRQCPNPWTDCYNL